MFRMKQWIKMLLQNVLLPVLYQWYSRKPIQPGSVLFADAHHASMPFSMQKMYEQMQEKERRGECRITLFIRDFGQLSFGEMVRFLLQFMRRYATAEYVFICDYFLPVSSCRKRPETTVVQLWHSCGLMKKIAYDTGEDIPKNYRGDMFGNYSCLTLSAEVCVPIHARALRLPAERIHATGVSRTDYYFDPAWNRARREAFYAKYPDAKGKKIALWAPTFRGNAARPRLEGLEAVRQVADTLQEDWMVLIKAHPHVDAHGVVSNCTIPTEELFAVADVLITDYSSVLFDYLLYRKPAVLFAPDLEDYEGGRGFYLDYQTIPYPIARTGAELTDAIRGGQAWMETHREAIDAFRERYVGACDGHATERIMQLTGLSSL